MFKADLRQPSTLRPPLSWLQLVGITVLTPFSYFYLNVEVKDE